VNECVPIPVDMLKYLRGDFRNHGGFGRRLLGGVHKILQWGGARADFIPLCAGYSSRVAN
jgi:hypothetical protein